jgi:hypothetical protein
MTEFLLFIIAITLIVIACKLPKKEEPPENPQTNKPLVAEILPSLIGKSCEFTLKYPSRVIGVFMTKATGKVLDVDSEWVLFSYATRNDEAKRVLRISLIKEVREIKD